MQQFYVLDTIEANDLRLFAGGQWVNDTRERCPACGAFRDDTEPPEIQIALNHIGRRGFAEFLWNSHGLPLFRQDLVDCWREARLTGFELRPVHIIGWYDSPRRSLAPVIPAYWRLIPVSKVQLSEPPPVEGQCSVCGFVKYAFPELGSHLPHGIRIDRQTWDGSDFCGIAGYGAFLFCSRRAAEVSLGTGPSRHIAFVSEGDYRRWDEFNIREWTTKTYQEYVEDFLIRKVKDL